jgi:hypothetical protein
MMMGALKRGGMNVHYSKSLEEKQMTRFAYCKANPRGFYEVEDREFDSLIFPREHEGKALKILAGKLPKIAPAPENTYKVIFMVRDPDEIKKSLLRLQNVWLDRDEFFLTNYQKVIDYYTGLMRVRRDVQDVVVVSHRDVLEHPVAEFRYLAELCEWPIEPIQAAKSIERKLWRCRV